MKDLMIKLSKSPIFWNIINGFISVITTEVTGLGIECAPLILAVLSHITKKINKKYNPYY